VLRALNADAPRSSHSRAPTYATCCDDLGSDDVAGFTRIVVAGNSAEPPSAYAPRLERRMNWTETERAQVYRLHALPEDWWDLDYEDFLQQRRGMMAEIIREAFERIR